MRWGANIGTLYPLVEVVFKGDSLPNYAATKIDETDQKLADLEEEICVLSSQLAEAEGNDVRPLELELESTEADFKIATESNHFLHQNQSGFVPRIVNKSVESGHESGQGNWNCHIPKIQLQPCRKREVGFIPLGCTGPANLWAKIPIFSIHNILIR